MGWRVVYIQECEYLSCLLDNLKVNTSEDHHLLIPLKDIHSLIIDNVKLVLSVQLINKCAENNVNLITCGSDHNPNSILIPHNGHHQMALEIRKQIEWTNEDKLIVHQLIIKQKITNQISILEHCGIKPCVNISKLHRYIEEVQLGDIANREGLAAKVYFRLLFGDEFLRFNEDVLNAGLNYGYAIVRSQINKVVVSKGLNSSIGIIHKGPSNMFNLSDDIIEPFRPLVDLWVYNHLRFASEFTREHRKMLVESTTGKIWMGNQKQTIFNAIVLSVDSLTGFFEHKGDLQFPSLDKVDDL